MSYDHNGNNTLDDDFNAVISSNIKNKRIEKGYSLEDVVSKMKVNQVTRQALYKYEQNKNHMKRETFKEICSIIDLDPNEVMKQLYHYMLNIFTYNTKWDVGIDICHIDEYIIRHVVETTDLLSNDQKEDFKNEISKYFNKEI